MEIKGTGIKRKGKGNTSKNQYYFKFTRESNLKLHIENAFTVVCL